MPRRLGMSVVAANLRRNMRRRAWGTRTVSCQAVVRLSGRVILPWGRPVTSLRDGLAGRAMAQVRGAMVPES